MQSITEAARREVRAVPGVRVARPALPQAGGRAPGGGVGLSYTSNPTAGLSARLVGFVGGSFLSVKFIRLGRSERVGGGKRKPCTGFSDGSRLNMQKTIAKLRVSAVQSGLFVTLTYPAAFPDGRLAKVHLDRFLKRLLRLHPAAGVFWRMEPQERGAPHFHLIILGVRFIPYQWVARAWHEVAGADLQAGTEVRRVKSYKHAVYYVSKYLTKKESAAGGEDDGLGEVGRRWGHAGRWREYLGEVVSALLSRSEVVRLARILDAKRLAEARQRKKVHARRRAIRMARRRRSLRLSRFWFASPDFVFSRLVKALGSEGVSHG